MEDVKLRPVGTLACHVRRTRASSQANIYRVASRPFARDSGACKKEFHSRNEVKIVRLRFLYINDSPPLDWHIILLSFQPETSERAMNFFFFSSFLFFFSKNEWIEKYSKIWGIVFKYKGNVWKVIRRMMKYLIRWNIVESSFDVETFFLQVNDFWYAKKWISNGFLFFFFLPRNIEVELCEFYSVFQFFFVEMLQLINIGTF